MKIKNLIMLLSILLCIAMLITACGKKEDPADEPVSDTAQAEDEKVNVNDDALEDGEEIASVEAVLKNFFEFEAVDTKVWGEATRYDGECISYKDGFFIMKTEKVDATNTVTDTYTVYNVNIAEPILTVSNTYQNGNYNNFYWGSNYVTNKNVRYPESVMKVSTIKVSATASVIEVARATLKALEVDEDVNPDGNYYAIAYEYSYYDAEGTFIAKSNEAVYYYGYGDDDQSSTTAQLRVTIGSTTAYLDTETGKLLKTVGVDNEVIYDCYDVQTYKYGYYLDQYSYGALGSYNYFFEVYNRQSGERVLRYNLEYADYVNTFVLRNGDILVQYINVISDDSELPYDYSRETYDGNLINYAVDHYLVDVETGVAAPVELGFVVEWLKPNTSLLAENAKHLAGDNVTLTRNVVNLAEISWIKDGRIAYNSSNMAVLNNDLSVMFELGRIVPEHKITGNRNNIDLGVEKLSSGNYVVSLVGTVTNRAIVSAKGVIRCYLNSDETIVGNYIVASEGIYDFDKNLVRSFEEYEYTVLGSVGSSLVVSKKLPLYEYDSDNDEYETVYYVVDLSGEYMNETAIFNTDDSIRYSGVWNRDLICFYNGTTNRYVFYNAKMEHVLTTYGGNGIPTVYELEDKYVINTYLDGHNVYYTIQ